MRSSTLTIFSARNGIATNTALRTRHTILLENNKKQILNDVSSGKQLKKTREDSSKEKENIKRARNCHYTPAPFLISMATALPNLQGAM